MMNSKQTAEPAYDVFPLGEAEETHVSMDTRATGLNNNVLVVGGTGAGKTFSVAYPMLMHLEHGNAVGIFTKRGMTEEISKILKKRGYRIFELDFVHPEKSPYGYDPLTHCLDDADIVAMSHSIINAGEKKTVGHEPFWNDSAESLLTPILRYVRSGAYGKGHSMKDALQLVDSIPLTSEYAWKSVLAAETDEEDEKSSEETAGPHEMTLAFTDEENPWGIDLQHKYKASVDEISELEDADPEGKQLMLRELRAMLAADPSGAASWVSFIRGADQTSKSILMTMMTPVQTLFSKKVRRILQQPKEFSFKELLKPKTVLFVYISPVNPSIHQFVSVFYQQMFKNLFELAENRRSGVLPRPVFVLCDDFATGAPIKEFPELISVFRAKGISTTLLIQSETQLASLYGKDGAKTIINNTDTYLFLGGMDIDTCVNVAKRLDVPYTDILNMPLGREIFFRRGQKPIVTQRYETLRDPLFGSWNTQELLRQ